MKHPKKDNILPVPASNSLPQGNRDSREDEFIRFLFLGMSVYDAGLKAGYSKSSLDSTIYTKFKNPKFQDKIRDYVIANNSASIPKVCDLYKRTVDQLHKEVKEGNLENVSKVRHIPRQILEIGRVLSPEGVQTANFVNIDQIQALIVDNVKAAKQTLK
jgi:hypothetical protein